MSSATGRLVLIRHGRTEWSVSGRHTGRTDLPLLADGERDAEALREPLAAFDVGLVVTSPLLRARRTAELAGLAPAETDDDLLEWDYGGYEGLTTPEIRAARGDTWTVFEHGVVPGDTPGETVEEVSARASRVLRRVWPVLDGGRDVVLVGHGHALRVLTATYLRQEPRFGAHIVLDAGALCVLGREHDRPALLAWNARALG